MTGQIAVTTPEVTLTLKATEDGELWLHLENIQGSALSGAFLIQSEGPLTKRIPEDVVRVLRGVSRFLRSADAEVGR